MAKCRACGKFLSSTIAATCVHCSAAYHKACIAVPGWACLECKVKLRKSNIAATPFKGTDSSNDTPSVNKVDGMIGCSAASETRDILKPTTPKVLSDSHIPVETEKYPTEVSNVDLGLEIRLFREEMRKVREEFKEFRQEIAGLRSMITSCNNRVDQFENRLIALEARPEDESAKINFLEETISQLKQELHDRDQDILQADIEISNLPESKGENPVHTATVLAAKLGLTVAQEDIVFAERVGRLNENSVGNLDKKCRRLVVRLTRRHLRDELLRSARVRRNITSADLCKESPARRIYLNERLTPANRRLFYLVRENARHLQWKYTWTKRGQIYARQAEGQRAYWIRSEEDRLRVFGNIDVSESKD